MDSIEYMFLKLLVREIHSSGHFGAFKGFFFLYSQTIFSQKNPQETQHQAGFRMQACLVSCQHGIQAQASHPGWECEQADRSPPAPSATSGSHSCHPGCTNSSMSFLCPWLACTRGKPGQPTSTSPLPHLSKCLSGACKSPEPTSPHRYSTRLRRWLYVPFPS